VFHVTKMHLTDASIKAVCPHFPAAVIHLRKVRRD